MTDHLLWYVMDGVGTMRLNGRVWELQAGSSFVFAPGAQPHGSQDPARRLTVFGMHFDVIDRDGARVLKADGMLPPPGHVVRDPMFFAILAQRCDASARRGDELGALQSCLFLQAMVLQIWEESLHPAPSPVDVALDDLVRTIQREPGHHWTVDELARQTHLSRAQFARRFRAATGLSPTQFLIHARLDRARQLIQDTDMPLSHIAYALGYDDVSFFSRQYKRHMGYTPRALRERNAGALLPSAHADTPQ